MRRRSLITLLISVPLLAQAASDDAAVWQDWLNWFRAQKEFPPFPELLRRFRTMQRDKGASPVEVNRRVNLIQKRIASDPDEWSKVAYNRIYSSATPLFNLQPNAFLMRIVQDLKPGEALDFGIGQGRNSVYLAQHGWDVTGFDIAEEGVAASRANAQRAGVKVNAVVADASSFDWGVDHWDLIVATYEDELSFAGRIAKALKPGGLLVIEDYLFDPAARKAPKDPRTVGPNDLLNVYRMLRILHYEDVDDISDWGARRSTRLVRLAAQKQ